MDRRNVSMPLGDNSITGRSRVVKASLILAVAFAAFFAASCDLGLGPQVDMKGPVLSVASPDYMEDVSRLFTVSGTVRDDMGIRDIVVTTDASSAAWKMADGAWFRRASEADPWEAWANGTYALGADGSYAWSVGIDLGTDNDGEFVVSVIAADKANNSDSASFQQRTVVVDNKPPVVSVSAPVIRPGSLADNQAALDALALRSVQDVGSLYNGDIPIRWAISEKFSIDSFTAELADAAGTVYYSRTLTRAADALSINGSFTIPASDIKKPDGSALTEKTYLQVITYAVDGANNREEGKSHGWFVWWPAADTPWVACDLSTSSAARSDVYPGYAIQGQAFDDDGVASVRVAIHPGTGTATTPISQVNLTNAERSGSFIWQIMPPSAAGDYTLAVQATDLDGAVSASFVGYFRLEDINAPDIVLEGPDSQQTLFGDASGSFTISGLAHDDTGISEVRLVWINPYGATEADSKLAYSSSAFADWNVEGADAKGNFRWNLPLGAATPWAGNATRMARSFTQSINLFSSSIALTLGGRPLRNFTFLLRAKDDNGKFRVQVLSTSGDRTAPSLAIARVRVRNSSGVVTFDEPFPANPSELFSVNRLAAGDTVSISGTWSDDSLTAWGVASRYTLGVDWGSVALAPTLNANGTWETAYVAAPDGAIANIQARLKDLGNNETVASASFVIPSDEASLVRITSIEPDGTYNTGKQLNIQLDFNKRVRLTGAPTITLSGGSIVPYRDASGTEATSHYFRWTVPAGANIAELDVTAFNANGCTWTVVDTGEVITVDGLPTGTNSLKDGRNIAIDTTAPAIASLTVKNAAGSYKLGAEIYFSLNFTEDVVVTNPVAGGAPSVTLTHGSAVAQYYSQANARELVLKYTVAAGENTETLAATSSLTLGAVTVTDAAGNGLTLSIPAPTFPAIRVDTTAPAAPVITGVAAGTFYSAQTFTLGGLEALAAVEYSLNGGSTWTPYPGGSGVTLSQNGGYSIQARQTDLAGNWTASTTFPLITIDSGSLLQRVSSSVADGVYTSGNLDITAHFRKNVWVEGTPRLLLNNGRYANYQSGSGSSTLTFRYAISNGDDITRLDASSIDWNGGVLRDAAVSGRNVNAETSLPDAASGNRLTDQKNIRIITGVPHVTGASLSGSTLTLTFDRAVKKGSGSLRLVQAAAGYRTPIAMTEAEWDEVCNKADAAALATLTASYTRGTNGATAAGVSDTSAKYVLNFGLDSDNASLVTLFRSAAIEDHVVSVPVVSGLVSVPSTPGTQVVFTLTGAYALPTLGALYWLEIPQGLVVDAYSNQNPASANDYSVRPAGVEPPVIRIQKSRETLALNAGVVRATQPLEADVKLDCRTPGAEIRYETTEAWNNSLPIDPAIDDVPYGSGPRPTPTAVPAAPAVPGAGSTLYSGSFTIGDALDREQGLKYRIRARALYSGTWSVDAWEIAYRSVLRMNNDGGDTLNPSAADGYSNTLVEQPWIRGGDQVTGSVLTPGFPLSWDITDYAGIRMMTLDSGNIWYWVSWDIGTTAYVGLLLGTTPTDPVEATNYGPKTWGWGKNAWVPFKEFFPLFPGESRTLQTGIYELGRGGFDFATTTQGGTTTRPVP